MGIPNDYMELSYRMEIVEDKDEGGFVVFYFCIHSETCESSEKESVERRNLHRHKRLSGSNGKSKIKRIKEFRRILYGCSKTVSVQDFFVLF